MSIREDLHRCKVCVLIGMLCYVMSTWCHKLSLHDSSIVPCCYLGVSLVFYGLFCTFGFFSNSLSSASPYWLSRMHCKWWHSVEAQQLLSQYLYSQFLVLAGHWGCVLVGLWTVFVCCLCFMHFILIHHMTSYQHVFLSAYPPCWVGLFCLCWLGT